MILLILSTRIARLAQLVERLTVNQDVTGSSPVGGAKENRMNKRKTACSCGSSYV